ncbi:MAG: hypothetical protein WCO08_00730 [Actinomycetes bacterium]
MTKKIIAVAAAISMSFILVASPSQAATRRAFVTYSAPVVSHSAIGPGYCCEF